MSEEVILIGRASGNDLVLPDPSVSREHVRIVRRGDELVAENLNPVNRLLVNGKEVREARLSHGDRLQMGQTHLVFRRPDDEPETMTGQGAYIAVDAHDRDGLVEDIDEASLTELRRARADLLSIYRAGRIVNASLSTDDLCARTLTTILDEMPAVDCCSIHLLNAHTDTLECRATQSRRDGGKAAAKPFSQTLLEKVLGEMQAILTFDAQDDGRFDDSRSIAFLDIRSAMCVPLQVQDRLTGVIQAHTIDPRKPFDVHDLKLLTAFGALAGAAIENASLYEKLDQERVQQTERARMMQVMVHELKSPIGVARQMADVLAQGYLEQEKQGDFLERIVVRLDNSLERIRDTLALSRLKANESPEEPERIDLCMRVPVLARAYREQATEKNLSFGLHIAQAPVCVCMEPMNLELVLSNLLSNAVKYTARGGVEVFVEAEDQWSVITVQDTGIGIPGKDLSRLYTEFFRASNARQARIDGSGVGLASVKYIVERAGGRIEVESQEQEGSRFRVLLPRRENGAGDEVQTASGQESGTGKNDGSE